MASRRLLLVEDSSTMRRMLSMKLVEEGYGIATANDGVQGLAKAREEPRAHLRIADLTRELAHTNGTLADRNRLLEAAHKKLTFELELARKVQLALMPRPPKPRGVLRLAVRYTPANQLGGDVYDIYRLENTRLGILVADVSGHGVNSAMLSGMVKALAAPLTIAVLEPGELLAGLD